MKKKNNLFIIEKAIDLAYKSAYNFRIFRENIGLESYKKLSFILNDVIIIMKNIGVNYDFIQLIKIANQRLEVRDYIGIADCMEYEIIPVFKDIESLLLLNKEEGKYENN
jgi:hypothetical protein